MTTTRRPGSQMMASPNTLKQILDRGIADANIRFRSATSSVDYSRERDVASSLRRALKSARSRAAVSSKPAYVPVDEIMRIITPENIVALLLQLPSNSEMTWVQKGELRDRVSDLCLMAPDYCCRRLVATLIDEEREGDILSVIEGGLRDDCLTSKQPDQAQKLFQILRIHDEPGKENFWASANKYTAPYFTRPQSGVNHYVFDLATVLPFKKQSQPASRAEISNSVKNTEGGQGGYGTVRRTTLHLSHHHFSDYGTSSEPGVVAIKQLDSHNRADFQKEIDALLPFSHRNDKQLVKLLATYEVLDDNVSTFYLIFPWAEANLRSLWHTHEKGGDTVYNLHWISGQALAIAKALEYMHEDYAKTFSDDPNSFDKQRFGRHGDIKAANFLVFQRNKEVLIFLADFGLSRFYRQKTRSMEPPKAMSPSYRPPECDTTGGTLSRKSDIWSLGAFFLEFLTWYLKGWKGVSIEFPDFREAPDLEDGRGLVSDIFFTIRVEGNIKTAVVKEKVHRWISRLHSSKASTQFVHDMLDLVQEKMLVVDKEKRITAGDLRKALQSIHEKCEKKENYLTPGRPYDEKKAK